MVLCIQLAPNERRRPVMGNLLSETTQPKNTVISENLGLKIYPIPENGKNVLS